MKIDLNYFPGFTRKSITFTIDDGNFEMDKKFLDIVRPAGIFGTFNLHHWKERDAEFYRELYKGYEIANHCEKHAIAIDEDVKKELATEPFDRNRPDYTREGGVDAPLGCSKWAKCGYPKSQDGRLNLTQFLTFLLDFALDATTFTVLDFFGF